MTVKLLAHWLKNFVQTVLRMDSSHGQFRIIPTSCIKLLPCSSAGCGWAEVVMFINLWCLQYINGFYYFFTAISTFSFAATIYFSLWLCNTVFIFYYFFRWLDGRLLRGRQRGLVRPLGTPPGLQAAGQQDLNQFRGSGFFHTLQINLDLCFPRKGIARPQS